MKKKEKELNYSKISFLKNGLSFYDEDTKLIKCKIMNENQCRIIFNCEDCKDKINNKDTINLIINDENFYIFHYINGHLKIIGIKHFII